MANTFAFADGKAGKCSDLADFNAKANGKWRMRCIRHRLCHFACEMAIEQGGIKQVLCVILISGSGLTLLPPLNIFLNLILLLSVVTQFFNVSILE
jgi:hypothetical protein